MTGAALHFLLDGIIAPLTEIRFASANQKGRFNGGVYHSDRSICTPGLQSKGGYENIPDDAANWPSEPVNGRGNVIFCGMLQNEHFGHFISESLSRLWATTQLGGRYNTIAFYLRHLHLPLAPFVGEVFQLLHPGHELKLVMAPTRFDTVAVPEQLTYGDSGFVYGHPFVRSALSPIRSLQGDAAPNTRIYVSRARLGARDGGIVAETRIEDHLRAEGYAIIHPERMSVRQQFETYNAATEIIFSEGSALHMYALVAKPTQKVFVIWRRERHPLFDWQIRSFGGQSIIGETHVTDMWIPTQDGGNPVHGRAVLDFPGLHHALRAGGFVKSDTKWDQPRPDAVREELAALSVSTGYDYVLRSQPVS